jgi:DNA-binding GntR family transcriptional regulator
MSKMTIRKAIDKLKEQEVLYAVRGRGVFVSSFHEHSKFKSLKKTLKANKVSYLPSSAPIPQILLNRFEEGYEIDRKKAISFIKIYYVEDKPVALTIN